MSSKVDVQTNTIVFNGLAFKCQEHLLVGTQLPSPNPSCRVDIEGMHELGVLLTAARSRGIINVVIGGVETPVSITGLPEERVVQHPQLKTSKLVQNVVREDTFTVELNGKLVTFEVSAM